jgi:hydrogenase maturation protease
LLSNKIKNIIRPNEQQKTLYIFVGNEMRSDDGIAPYIFNNLKSFHPETLTINAKDKIENIVDQSIDFKPHKTIIFDAANFCNTPGKIKLLKPKELNRLLLSTHSFPITFFTNILAYETNSELYFIGIQAYNLNIGDKISEPVISAGKQIINFFNKDV